MHTSLLAGNNDFYTHKNNEGETKMSAKKYTLTSESVSEGHPDKICDQISDAILDELLRQDPYSRVAVETMVTTGSVHIAGEVTTKAYCDIHKIVRDTLKEIGYRGYITYEMCEVLKGGGSIENLDRSAKKFLEYVKQFE